MEASVALRDPILDSIERDLAAAKDQLVRYESESAGIDGHFALVDAEDAIWNRIIDELGVESMDDCPDDVLHELHTAQRAVDSSRKRMTQLEVAIAQTKRKIATLHTTAEYDRRAGVKVRTTEAKRRSNMAKETAKDQGVPEIYLNEETGNFKIGMDARYKSDLVNSALGLEGVGMLQKFEAKDAEDRLAKRDWTGFLDRKKEIVAEKETKAAAAAEKKEAAARERAEKKEADKAAKEAAKAEKQTLAQAAAAEAKEGEVKSDPKPTGSRRK